MELMSQICPIKSSGKICFPKTKPLIFWWFLNERFPQVNHPDCILNVLHLHQFQKSKIEEQKKCVRNISEISHFPFFLLQIGSFFSDNNETFSHIITFLSCNGCFTKCAAVLVFSSHDTARRLFDATICEWRRGPGGQKPVKVYCPPMATL